MALTSFTLRKQTIDYGSALRNPTTDDNSIRSDGISSFLPPVASSNTFSANILTATTVRLEWVLSEPLVLESTTVGASVASPVEILIVSSATGEPVTIKDGSTVVSITAQSTSSTYIDTPKVLQGRWVYYSLFVKYQAGSDYWYTNEASLYVQMPTQYNSINSLWSYIPEYYRGLDESQEVLSGGYNPLYGFLELFGNEVDRTRTLIDSVAIANDPNIAVTPALEQLAIQTGLEIGIKDLGTSKARSLLNNIGSLRQRKGTIGSIISYISGMSGCGASYEYNAGASFPHIFHVTAQRLNFIADPKFQQAVGSTTADTVGSYKRTRTTTATWGIVTSTTAALPGSPPYLSVSQDDEGINITMDPAWGSSVNTVRVYPQKAFPYNATETYYCSFDTGASAGASFSGLYTMTDADKETMQSASPPSTWFNDTHYQNEDWDNVATMTSDTPQRRVFEYSSQSGASAAGLVENVPVLEFEMTGGSTVRVARWLWEPTFVGEYFDGATRDGGYIPSTSGVAGVGVFDYFWGDGGVNSDFSYYLLDRQRTLETTERVLAQYVVPVTMLNQYTLDWNYYLGK
jgi:hypothetical protein